jgi:hypothetical protein
LEFGLALDDYIAGLNDFVPAQAVGYVFIFGEAETVAAYYDSVLEHDVVAYMAELADDGVRVREEVVADGDSAIDDNVSEEHGVVSDDGVFVERAAALYLGFETKVSWPGAASSIPATALISVSGAAFSSFASRALAMSDSFISGVWGNCSGRREVRGQEVKRSEVRGQIAEVKRYLFNLTSHL